jgi:hypothetical protein
MIVVKFECNLLNDNTSKMVVVAHSHSSVMNIDYCAQAAS